MAPCNNPFCAVPGRIIPGMGTTSTALRGHWHVSSYSYGTRRQFGRTKGKGLNMTKTRRQTSIAGGSNRASRWRSGRMEFGAPRSRRRYGEAGGEDHRARRRGRTRRGFAAMNPRQQRKIASLGGRSFHRTPRGFAAMGGEQRRRIASAGGRAFHRRPRGFAAMDRGEQREIAARGGSAPRRGPRGFAAMEPRQQRRIAARGGHASHRRS
jgi:hypothetical protein